MIAWHVVARAQSQRVIEQAATAASYWLPGLAHRFRQATEAAAQGTTVCQDHASLESEQPAAERKRQDTAAVTDTSRLWGSGVPARLEQPGLPAIWPGAPVIAGSPFPLPSIPEARDAGVKHFGNVRSIKGLLIAILTFPFRLGMPFISMLPRAWKVLGRRPKAFSDGDCNHASVPANAQKLKGQGARQDKFWSDPGPQVGHTLSIVGTLGGRSFITWAQRMLTSTGTWAQRMRSVQTQVKAADSQLLRSVRKEEEKLLSKGVDTARSISASYLPEHVADNDIVHLGNTLSAMLHLAYVNLKGMPDTCPQHDFRHLAEACITAFEEHFRQLDAMGRAGPLAKYKGVRKHLLWLRECLEDSTILRESYQDKQQLATRPEAVLHIYKVVSRLVHLRSLGEAAELDKVLVPWLVGGTGPDMELHVSYKGEEYSVLEEYKTASNELFVAARQLLSKGMAVVPHEFAPGVTKSQALIALFGLQRDVTGPMSKDELQELEGAHKKAEYDCLRTSGAAHPSSSHKNIVLCATVPATSMTFFSPQRGTLVACIQDPEPGFFKGIEAMPARSQAVERVGSSGCEQGMALPEFACTVAKADLRNALVIMDRGEPCEPQPYKPETQPMKEIMANWRSFSTTEDCVKL